jgi:hypothetical protein
VASAKKVENVGFYGFGVAVMVGLVLVLQVRDTRVLPACAAVLAALIVGLVAFCLDVAGSYLHRC